VPEARNWGCLATMLSDRSFRQTLGAVHPNSLGPRNSRQRPRNLSRDHRRSRPVIVVLDAHDIIPAEIAAGLHLDQYRDHRRRAKYRPEVLSSAPAGNFGFVLPNCVGQRRARSGRWHRARTAPALSGHCPRYWPCRAAAYSLSPFLRRPRPALAASAANFGYCGGFA
jgi:hypothetical protein